MKETRSLLNSLVACGVALAMVSTLAAQSVDQSAAKVVRLKGGARYSTGNNDWQPLKLGDVVRPGTVIQTAGESRVDLVLGDASAPVARPVPSDMISYQPTAEQNIVRIWENTLLGVDKLTEMQTGADVVTETQLDLKAGHIFGIGEEDVRRLEVRGKNPEWRRRYSRDHLRHLRGGRYQGARRFGCAGLCRPQWHSR